MPSIDSVRTGSPSLDELHEAQPQSTAGAAPPEKKNAVQAFTRPAGEDQPVDGDSRLESFFRERFAGLDPGQSYDLEGKLDITDAFSGQFRGKLHVERQPDGTFTVKTDESGALGLGARVIGKARATVAAGTTFHVKNAAEAADLCDALVKYTSVGALPYGEVFSALRDGAYALGARGDTVDAGARLRQYQSRAKEVRFEAGVKAELGDKVREGFAGFDAEATLKASLKGTEAISVDRESGEVNLRSKLELTGEAKAKLPLHNTGEAEGKATVAVTTSLKMPPGVREAFARGELSIAEAVAQTMNHPADVRCSAEAEVELKGNLSLMAPSAEGKAVLKAEFELTSTEAADPRVLANLMAEAKYSVEFDGALGGKLSADLGVADAELSVTRHARIQPYGGELFSLEVAVKRGVSELKANDPGALDARRATANLR